MAYGDFPIIRVSVEGMKHTLCHALSEHFAARDADMQAAIQECLDNFDVKAYCRNEVQEAIPRMLRDIIQQAVREALWINPKVKTKIANAVADVLREELQ